MSSKKAGVPFLTAVLRVLPESSLDEAPWLNEIRNLATEIDRLRQRILCGAKNMTTQLNALEREAGFSAAFQLEDPAGSRDMRDLSRDIASREALVHSFFMLMRACCTEEEKKTIADAIKGTEEE